MAMVTAGFPDYSEVFEFSRSGQYTVNVLVKRKGAARPVQARFTVNRVF
jgi:formylmethanofuran dehydrogenase subunit E-like metal-binding protein